VIEDDREILTFKEPRSWSELFLLWAALVAALFVTFAIVVSERWDRLWRRSR
jgi:hypothetical protein